MPIRGDALPASLVRWTRPGRRRRRLYYAEFFAPAETERRQPRLSCASRAATLLFAAQPLSPFSVGHAAPTAAHTRCAHFDAGTFTRRRHASTFAACLLAAFSNSNISRSRILDIHGRRVCALISPTKKFILILRWPREIFMRAPRAFSPRGFDFFRLISTHATEAPVISCSFTPIRCCC